MWRPNLRVLPRCLALRVVFEGRRASGSNTPAAARCASRAPGAK